MRRSNGIGIICGVFGVIVLILGGFLLFIGTNAAYSLGVFKFQYSSMYGPGKTMSIAGVALMATGIIILIVTLYNGVWSGRRFFGAANDRHFEGVEDVIEQLSGNRTIFGVFHSKDNNKALSIYQNNICILKEGEQIHRGTMEPSAWVSGKPTVWRMTFNVDGSEKSCEISRVENNILLKNNSGEEIYYRD